MTARFPMEITPGQRLGPYKILKHLGSGGMGVVYLAYDERLERQVALKMLTPRSGDDAAKRVLREARAVARLNHANVAGLYDMFEHEHEAFLVMEYVDGEPLTSLVRSQPVSFDRAVEIGLQLCEALRYAHREGIIHRDVKPANVMLTRDGKVKVLDLGLARAATDPGADTRSESDVVPSRAGTPAYMAPERLGGHPADERTDVYSVGVVLFELLTGKRPFTAPDLMSLAVSVASQPTPRVRSLRRDVPAALDDLVARAMARDPATRFATAAELHEALARVREGLSGKRTRRLSPVDWKRWTVTGVMIAAALALAGWLLFRYVPPAGPPTIAIPPIVNGSADQPDLEELGVLLQSVLSRNLAELPGITIVPSEQPAATVAGAQLPPPPGHVMRLKIRRAVSKLAADASLLRAGRERPEVQVQLEGDDALDLLRRVTDWAAGALEANTKRDRSLTDAERTRLRALPTSNGQALSAYLSARMLLDTSDDQKTDERAIALFTQATGLDGAFAFAHAGVSQAYSSLVKHSRNNRELDAARAAATQALRIDPECDQAIMAQALVLRALTQRDNAVVHGRRAVAVTPDSDEAHRVLGLTLLDQGQTDAGLAELQSATRLRPLHGVNYYVLGTQLMKANRYRDAIEPLLKARELMPKFESAFVNLGYAYQSLGDWQMAVGNYQLALNLNSEDESALTNLATAYYWNHQFDEALKKFSDASRRDPTNPKRYMNLGDTYDALKRTGPAREAYAKAITLADAQNAVQFSAPTAAIAAKCEAKLSNFSQALTRALAALASEPGNSDVIYKLAVVYALKGETDNALGRLEEAIKHGYPWVYVRDDPDLRSISSHPKFKALLSSGR